MGTVGNEPHTKTVEELMLELGKMRVLNEADRVTAQNLVEMIIGHPDCTGHDLVRFISDLGIYGAEESAKDGWLFAIGPFRDQVMEQEKFQHGLTLDDFLTMSDAIGEDDHWWELIWKEFRSYPIEKQIAEHRQIMLQLETTESKWKFLCWSPAEFNVGNNRLAGAIARFFTHHTTSSLDIKDDFLAAQVDAIEHFMKEAEPKPRTVRDFGLFIEQSIGLVFIDKFISASDRHREFWKTLNKLGSLNIATQPPETVPDIDATVFLSAEDWNRLELEFCGLLSMMKH
jgi:hypothetical protein